MIRSGQVGGSHPTIWPPPAPEQSPPPLPPLPLAPLLTALVLAALLLDALLLDALLLEALLLVALVLEPVVAVAPVIAVLELEAVVDALMPPVPVDDVAASCPSSRSVEHAAIPVPPSNVATQSS